MTSRIPHHQQWQNFSRSPAASAGSLIREQCFIDGEWTGAASGMPFPRHFAKYGLMYEKNSYRKVRKVA